MIVALLNRWASLQHVAPGLARLCGWLPLVPIRVPLGLSVLPDGTRVSLRVFESELGPWLGVDDEE